MGLCEEMACTPALQGRVLGYGWVLDSSWASQEDGNRARCLWLEPCRTWDRAGCKATTSPTDQLTLWLEHWEELRHSTVKAPPEESDGQGIVGWWVLHKMNRTREVWMSNLITVPDLMNSAITWQMPWPALAKVAVTVRNPVWMPSVRPVPPTAPTHESLISGNPELWNQTLLSSAISTTH